MRFFICKLTISVLSAFSVLACTETSKVETDVLIIGGGASGTAAAIASARMGSKTILVAEDQWLGGMLTSAGVSAVDGNTKLPSGVWGEFRDSLVVRYGSLDNLKTGWVSNTMFEPSVGAEIFKNMVQNQPNLKVFYGFKWKNVENTGIWNVTIENPENRFTIEASQLIDATELGDVAASLGIPYYLGMDPMERFNEDIAPEYPNDVIQDLTYVMTLKDYGYPVMITKPEGYNPEEFYCSTAHEKCNEPLENRTLWSPQQMIDYGKLQNGRYMINWPIFGNDYYANVIELSDEERELQLEKAKQKSLRFLYYIQNELGFINLGIDNSQYPTEDGFPLIPYYRESRRIHGVTTLTLNHVAKPYEQESPLYRTGIAVGDYPIDHHHNAHPSYQELPELHFYPVPSYNVPLGVIIPIEMDNILVAEKSISVSNIVNGTTRLQPVVMQIGYAAGILASLAAKRGVTPGEVGVREVQELVLNGGGYLFPYLDVQKSHPFFKSYQKIGATGILKGTGLNVGWENQTWYYPEKELNLDQIDSELFEEFFDGPKLESVVIEDVLKWLAAFPKINDSDVSNWITNIPEVQQRMGFDTFEMGSSISRGQFSVLVDQLLDPFSISVDLNGNIAEIH